MDPIPYREQDYPAGSPVDRIATAIELVTRRILSRPITKQEFLSGLCVGLRSAVKDAEYVLGDEDIRKLLLTQLTITLLPETGIEEND